MHIILLSGGSGKRVWPLSNEIRSKQFLSLLDDGKRGHESMLKRVFRQIKSEFHDANIIIATGKNQYEQILSELGDSVEVVLEPERRDTFPAIALSCGYLALSKQIPADEVVVVLPVDVFAEQSYFSVVSKIATGVELGIADLVLMGIEPDGPAEKFGYILPKEQKKDYAIVKGFVEKPQSAIAKELIGEGAVWNGGVFGFKLGYMLDILNSHITLSTYEHLYASYGQLEKTSFDYAVVEKATSIAMILYDGMWKDLGTWETLTEEMGVDVIGDALVAENMGGTTIVNELDIPIVALGTGELIIAASQDGILVANKESSSRLKGYVDTLNRSPRYEILRWGTKKVLQRIPSTSHKEGEISLITIKKGETMTVTNPSETKVLLSVVSGSGVCTKEGEEIPLGVFDTVCICNQEAYTVCAKSTLIMLQTSEKQLPSSS